MVKVCLQRSLLKGHQGQGQWLSLTLGALLAPPIASAHLMLSSSWEVSSQALQEGKNGSPSSWLVSTVGARRSFLQGVPNQTNLLIPYSPYEEITPKHRSFLSQPPLAFPFRSHSALLGNQSIQPVLSTWLGGARWFLLFLWKIPSESSDPCSYRTMNYEK